MSLENAIKFFNDSAEKPEIKNIFNKVKSDFNSEKARSEYMVKEAKKLGYNFTVDDLKKLDEMHEQYSSGSISDDNLANVAGGAKWQETVADATNLMAGIFAQGMQMYNAYKSMNNPAAGYGYNDYNGDYYGGYDDYDY